MVELVPGEDAREILLDFAAVQHLGAREFLDSMIGDDYVSVGFTYYQGTDSGWAFYQTDIPNPPRPASLDAVNFFHVQPSPTVQVLRCVRKVVLEAKRVGDAVAFIP